MRGRVEGVCSHTDHRQCGVAPSQSSEAGCSRRRNIDIRLYAGATTSTLGVQARSRVKTRDFDCSICFSGRRRMQHTRFSSTRLLVSFPGRAALCKRAAGRLSPRREQHDKSEPRRQLRYRENLRAGFDARDRRSGSCRAPVYDIAQATHAPGARGRHVDAQTRETRRDGQPGDYPFLVAVGERRTRPDCWPGR
jgi:hypothetical protein